MTPLKYISIAGAIFAISIAAFWGLFTLHLGHPWWNFHSNREIWIAKRFIASQTQGPTIWLQGGSATWFGYDSESIQSKTGYNVVNLGFNASFPIDFMTEEIMRYAKPGDIAVLSLEYELLWKPKYNTYSVNELSIWNPDYFRSRSLSNKLSYLKKHSWRKILASDLNRFTKALDIVDDNTFTLISDSDIQSNLQQKWGKSYTDELPTFYNYLDCSPNGDYTYQEERQWDSGSDYELMEEHEVSNHAKNTLTDFAQWCQANNITPCITWPSIALNPLLDLEALQVINNLGHSQNTIETLGYQLLGTPFDFVADISDFYDTNYHLTPKGRENRTRIFEDKLSTLLPNRPTPQ